MERVGKKLGRVTISSVALKPCHVILFLELGDFLNVSRKLGLRHLIIVKESLHSFLEWCEY